MDGVDNMARCARDGHIRQKSDLHTRVDWLWLERKILILHR